MSQEITGEKTTVERLLSQDTFTIPVVLTTTDDEGDEQTSRIFVTYRFGKEEQNIFDPKDGRTTTEQLTILVKKVKDVTADLNRQYWEGVPRKHKDAIGKAILNDVFPSLKTSVGS